ncbi:MAG: VOC family protein [Nevskia sp.]|nr:VOC family protein [Nevskia sp.]
MSAAQGHTPTTAQPGSGSSLKRVRGINHVAYRCRDADQTRWFYEEVLGLPLVGVVVDEKVPGLGHDLPYMHLFFELGNGEYVAFFDQPASATPGHFERVDSFDRHLAMEVKDEAELLAWQARINSRGVSCLGPLDHGFVKSVYMYDPNGLQVELTYRTPEFDRMLRQDAEAVNTSMRAWAERFRAEKERKFGAAAIDQRSRHQPAR